MWVKIYRRHFSVKEQSMYGLWNIKYALYSHTVLVWCINLKAKLMDWNSKIKMNDTAIKTMIFLDMDKKITKKLSYFKVYY